MDAKTHTLTKYSLRYKQANAVVSELISENELEPDASRAPGRASSQRPLAGRRRHMSLEMGLWRCFFCCGVKRCALHRGAKQASRSVASVDLYMQFHTTKAPKLQVLASSRCWRRVMSRHHQSVRSIHPRTPHQPDLTS